MDHPYTEGMQLRLRRDVEGLVKDTIVFVSHFADDFPSLIFGRSNVKVQMMFFKDFDIPYIFDNGSEHEDVFEVVTFEPPVIDGACICGHPMMSHGFDECWDETCICKKAVSVS